MCQFVVVTAELNKQNLVRKSRIKTWISNQVRLKFPLEIDIYKTYPEKKTILSWQISWIYENRNKSKPTKLWKNKGTWEYTCNSFYSISKTKGRELCRKHIPTLLDIIKWKTTWVSLNSLYTRTCRRTKKCIKPLYQMSCHETEG